MKFATKYVRQQWLLECFFVSSKGKNEKVVQVPYESYAAIILALFRASELSLSGGYLEADVGNESIVTDEQLVALRIKVVE